MLYLPLVSRGFPSIGISAPATVCRLEVLLSPGDGQVGRCCYAMWGQIRSPGLPSGSLGASVRASHHCCTQAHRKL